MTRNPGPDFCAHCWYEPKVCKTCLGASKLWKHMWCKHCANTGECLSCAGTGVNVANEYLRQKDRIEVLEKALAMSGARYSWKDMKSAPLDREITLLTMNSTVVDGFWNEKVLNYYKSNPRYAVYDPDDYMGDWCMSMPVEEMRMFCGDTPVGWMEKIEAPEKEPLLGWGKFGNDPRPFDWSMVAGMSNPEILLELKTLEKEAA